MGTKRIGLEGPIFGIPDWLGKLFGCKSQVIQKVTLTFKNRGYAFAEANIAVEDASGGLKTIGPRFLLFRDDGATSTDAETNAFELADSHGDIASTEQDEG